MVERGSLRQVYESNGLFKNSVQEAIDVAIRGYSAMSELYPKKHTVRPLVPLSTTFLGETVQVKSLTRRGEVYFGGGAGVGRAYADDNRELIVKVHNPNPDPDHEMEYSLAVDAKGNAYFNGQRFTLVNLGISPYLQDRTGRIGSLDYLAGQAFAALQIADAVDTVCAALVGSKYNGTQRQQLVKDIIVLSNDLLPGDPWR